MQSLSRKMSLRASSQASVAALQASRALARTGQVARSTIELPDGDVFIDEMLSSAADTAVAVEGHEGELEGSRDVTDGVVDALPEMTEDAWEAEEVGQIAADGADWASEVAAAAGERVDEAKAVAESAAEMAATAQSTADGKNARRVGSTEPAAPEGGWAQGDQWIVLNAEGAPVAARVWNGSTFVPEQVLTSDLLVLGEDGTVRIADGKITAPALAVDALDFKSARGLEIVGGSVRGGEILQIGQSAAVGSYDFPIYGPEDVPAWSYGGLSTDVPAGVKSTRSLTGSGTASYKLLTWNLPTEFMRRRVLIRVRVKATTATRVTAGLGYPTDQDFTVPANTWREIIYTPQAGMPSDGWGRFTVRAASTALLVTEPVVQVLAQDEFKAALETRGGDPGLWLYESGKLVGSVTPGAVQLQHQSGSGESLRNVRVRLTPSVLEFIGDADSSERSGIAHILAGRELRLSATTVHVEGKLTHQTDMPWTPLLIQPGYAQRPGEENTPSVCRVAGVCYTRGTFQTSSGNWKTGTVLPARMPDWAIPEAEVSVLQTGLTPFDAWINSSGELRFAASQNPPTFFKVNATYVRL